MIKSRRRSLLAFAGVTALLAPLANAAPAAAEAGTFAEPTLEVIASGMNQPRHLLVKDGTIWVAEGGTGGNEFCVNGSCLGHSGTIATVDTRTGAVQRVVQGLPSVLQNTGIAGGPADVFLANGRITVAMGNIAPMTDPATGDTPFEAYGPELGRLVHIDSNGTKTLSPDFGYYEIQNNPDGGLGAAPGGERESNPNGVTAYNGGYVVVDAAANDVLFVNAQGQVSTLAVLPAEQIGDQLVQSVPTAVEVGPDGALYVSTLRPAPGHAQVYRIVPGQAPTVYAEGFNQVMDLAFDQQGRLLALAWSVNGAFFPPSQAAIVRVEADGTKTQFAPPGLFTPTGIAVEGRNVYVAHKAIQPGGVGEIVRVRLP